ncbi:hypothetical protein BGT96224_2266 [Blumeria graminis f. sp. tritici 96224]|uniref:DJ-1/PfpI domain-containing protein n=1 Tax=Blumeria graminis f. sp. tritici 96224 TaxID=1268274 RepID=A0A656KFK0_BLUGR|nr:hypothetical protein BGT96224_2266 [Blumeria graminis f. sp. tritici 96224]
MTASNALPLIRVLITMHPGIDTLDVTGPLEVLSLANKIINKDANHAFEFKFVSATKQTKTAQAISLQRNMNYKQAHARLSTFDILMVPGGGVEKIIRDELEPLGLIKAFSDLQKKDPSRERTIFSICTGSLLLAHQGLLSGLQATTHPDFFAKFIKIDNDAALRGLNECCDVVEERYVVNNLRFDAGEKIDKSPHVSCTSDFDDHSVRQECDQPRKDTSPRASGRLRGLRVITSGGITCGIDASLYLVRTLVSSETAVEVGRIMMYECKQGIIVS